MVEQYLDYITGLRQKFHKYPELSNQEFLTNQEILKVLRKDNIEFETVGTGVIARLNLQKEKTIAYRCDLDALPIIEKNDVAFKSKNENMHACGHDGHIAILLTFIKWAVKNKDKIKYNLVFIFQPAEESSGGALKMIEAGCLKNVDEIYAIHVNPDIEAGVFGAKSGLLMAGVVEFDIDFSGVSCHVADYKKGIDANAAAVEFLAGNIISEPLKDRTIFHCGKLFGGYARNVVSNFCKLECTVRFFDTNDRNQIFECIKKRLNEVNKKNKTDSKTNIITEYVPLVNDDTCIKKIKKLAKCVDIEKKFSAEDFAFYLTKVKGAFVWLGTKDKKHFAPLHSDNFNFDEKHLITGLKLYIDLAVN